MHSSVEIAVRFDELAAARIGSVREHAPEASTTFDHGSSAVSRWSWCVSTRLQTGLQRVIVKGSGNLAGRC
jgi:hypothetical protein